MPTRFIQDKEHYSEVLSKVASVRKSVWIGTADIKDLYLDRGNGAVPFLGVLADLIRKGVEVRR